MIANNFENLSDKTLSRIGEFQQFLDTNAKRGKSSDEKFRIKTQNSSKLTSNNFRMRPKSGNISAALNLTGQRQNIRPNTSGFLASTKLYTRSLNTCNNLNSTDTFPESLGRQMPTLQSTKELSTFISNSALFQTFKQELQDLYDLVRDPDNNYKSDESLSLYFALREELDSEFSLKIETIENDLHKVILKSINFNRELIKQIKVKADKDLAILVEFMIRFHFKIVDRTYQTLMKTIENLEKMNLDSLDTWKGARKIDIQRAKETFNLKTGLMQEELKNLETQNLELKSTISKLKSELSEKNKQIINLTEIDTSVPAMQSFENLLKSLTSVISDTKDQRKQKSEMIQGFQNFFASVEEVSRPATCISIQIQTDWSFQRPKFPVKLLSHPIFSKNLLFKLDPGASEQPLNSLKTKVIESLLSFNSKKTFLFTLSENIFEFFQKKSEKINALYQAVIQITEGFENWNILGRLLLGIGKNSPKIVERTFESLLKVFSSYIDLENSEISMPAEQFITLTEKLFKNFPKFQCWILSKMIIYTEKNFNGKVQDSFSAFCMRFAVKFDKTKENLKQSLEKFSRVKTGLGNFYLVSFETFQKFLNKRLKFVYFIEELYQVWEHAGPDLYNIVSIHKLIQDLNFSYNLQLVRRSSVSILDFLQLTSDFFVSELKIHKKKLSQIKEFEDTETLTSFLTENSINFSPEDVSIIYTKLILGEPISSISSELSLYPTDLVLLSEIGQNPAKTKKK